ncbi:hypothetical protein BpHYR1_025802 [Brachionus plicatilis]|uniref:Uncharacterized protein n=1 Tax=Brachionus plicatilis TaxID=10195 RepID=A0A3M7PWZ9_BRAPC|nr:hypothetical protein BpHYR1_025802 [Brachionus plicatilis]
MIKLPEFP